MTLVPIAPRHVGWQTADGMVAEVHMERDGDELTIVTLEHSDVGAVCELIEAVVGVAVAKRIYGDEPILEQCGFSLSDGRWVRELGVEPGRGEATHAVTLTALEGAIREAWGPDTSEGPDEWTADNPAWGNCAVTALVVRDYLGGELVIAGVVRDGSRVDRHVWNRLPSGLMLDLTREQFRNGEQFETPGPLEELFVGNTEERYELLAARVRAKLHGT